MRNLPVCCKQPEQCLKPKQWSGDWQIHRYAGERAGYCESPLTTVSCNRHGQNQVYIIIWNQRLRRLEEEYKDINIIQWEIASSIKNTYLGKGMNKHCVYALCFCKDLNKRSELFMQWLGEWRCLAVNNRNCCLLKLYCCKGVTSSYQDLNVTKQCNFSYLSNTLIIVCFLVKRSSA